MSDVPVFFISGVATEKQEEAYAAYAKMCDQNAPEAGRRIYSITFTHDWAVWTATVGGAVAGVQDHDPPLEGPEVRAAD